jgi:hypothetical protein
VRKKRAPLTQPTRYHWWRGAASRLMLAPCLRRTVLRPLLIARVPAAGASFSTVGVLRRDVRKKRAPLTQPTRYHWWRGAASRLRHCLLHRTPDLARRRGSRLSYTAVPVRRHSHRHHARALPPPNGSPTSPYRRDIIGGAAPPLAFVTASCTALLTSRGVAVRLVCHAPILTHDARSLSLARNPPPLTTHSLHNLMRY